MELILSKGLKEDEVRAIRGLAEVVENHDGIVMKLNMSSLKSRATDQVSDFLLWDNGQLIGYCGLHHFVRAEIEVTGMIHPEFRRLGFYGEMNREVRAEALRRGVHRLLHICERRSEAGAAWAKQEGACYEFSEYAMVFSGTVSEELTGFRPAVESDIPALSELDQLCFGGTLEDNLKMNSHKMSDPDRLILTAKEKDVLIGKSGMRFGEGYIFGVAVKPDYRGRGWGRKLLLASVAELKKRNCPRINLEVACANETALNLYKSAGFETVSAYDYYEQKI